MVDAAITRVTAWRKAPRNSGKIPSGIQLANKLRQESKKPIPDFIEFQSEIMLVTQPHLAELPSLTGLDSTATSSLEQNIFWANQVIQFGKLLAVLQQHPTEQEAAIATVYILIAVRNDVLNKQREYSNTPMLRNLVPATAHGQQLLQQRGFAERRPAEIRPKPHQGYRRDHRAGSASELANPLASPGRLPENPAGSTFG
jgi:hypothetical protein